MIALPALGAAILLVGGPLAKGRLDKHGHLLGTALPVAVVRDQRRRCSSRCSAATPTTARSASTCTPGSRPAASTSAFDLLYDPLSSLFLLLITGVGSLIHIYSIGYMEHDPRRRRFFGYLNLFVAAMLMLVLVGNYLGAVPRLGGRRPRVVPADRLLAAQALGGRGGEEGVHRQPGRRHRALAGASMLFFATFGTTDFAGDQRGTRARPPTATMTALGLLLLLAACGKSAQVPLQSWLLDAMEGPTPVSALIHAATMVTAGVYLDRPLQLRLRLRARRPHGRGRSSATVTLLFGAIIGCAKDDIKKALAGSTMSQIGYMMLAAGHRHRRLRRSRSSTC